MKGACPVCDNRLFSDGHEEHRRYVTLIESEHRKRTLFWFGGWTLIALVVLPPLLMLATGRFSRGYSAGALVWALIVAWRLIDLKKKRDGSARFLAIHRNA